MSLANFSVRNPLPINLITALAVILGIYCTVNIQKEAFPPISFDMVTVRTTYPGASPEVVEKFVTIKLEDELKSVDGIDEMSSVSAQNISLIALQLDPDNKNKRKVINDIQRAVDRVKDLPVEVEENPVVTEVEADKFPVITICLTGVEYSELQRQSKILEDRLLELDDVGSVERSGYYEPEIWVEVDPEKALLYHISISQIAEAIRDHNINLTGGEIDSIEGELNVRTNGEFEVVSDVEKVVIRSNDQGKLIRVTDVAKVLNRTEEQDILYSTNSLESINLLAVKKPSGDIITMIEEIKSVVEEFKGYAPEKLQISYVDDWSYFVKRRLGVLVNNGMQGGLLILILLFLILSPPIAASAALDIPVTFIATILCMSLIGVSLNLMSMFGMIMVIGMLVDDVIIMAENVFRHIEGGGDVREAAVKGAQEVIKPVTASVLTSICAYLPLAMMSGIIGQYVRSIPIVVTIALIISWLTTVFATPTHAVEFSILMGKTRWHDAGKKKHWFDNLREGYMRVLKIALKHRYIVLASITAFGIGTVLLAVTSMKFVLFPSDGMDEFFIRTESKMGTSVEEIQKRMLPVESILSDLSEDEMENYVTEIGVSRETSGDPMTEYGSHLGQVHVYLTPSVDRKRSAFEIIEEVKEKIRDVEGFEEVRVDNVRPGPPVGRAVEAKIRGDDFESIRSIASEFKEYLKTLPGAINIDDDFQRGKDELNIVLDREKIARANLTYRAVATEVRSAFEGNIATTIQKSDEEIDIRIKFSEDSVKSIELLKLLHIPNPQGQLVPLKEIASINRIESISAIKRFERKRMVTVFCDADESVTSSIELNKKLLNKFHDVRSRYPGCDVVYTGEQERTAESLVSLLVAFVTAMLLIFCIISIQFRSLIQTPVVMMTIPLGLFGVVWALYFHQKPFSFLSIMGFIGLSGVVVNDSIVLIDFMNRLRRKGIERFQSILESCNSRFRAVFMASVTTVAGTMPMAYGWGGDDPFIKPMALAFTWGMAFASTITLFAIPCFYAILDDITVNVFHRSLVKVSSEGENK